MHLEDLPDEAATPLPSLNDVLKLIQVVSDPGHPPAQVQHAQRLISSVASSPHGWEYAIKLLDTPNGYARFHGASILKAKICKEWMSLQNDAIPLIGQLMTWFLRCVNDHSGKMAIRKVAAALIALLLRTTHWTGALRHLACALKQKSDFVPTNACIADHSALQGLWSQEIDHVYSLLEFSRCLAEGYTVFESFHETRGVEEKLLYELRDTKLLIEHILRSSQDTRNALLTDATQCFLAWCEVSMPSPEKGARVRSDLRSLMPTLISQAELEGPDTTIVSALLEVLERFSQLLAPEHSVLLAEKLASADTIEHTLRAWRNEDRLEIVSSYVDLLVAYAEIAIEQIVLGDGHAFQALQECLFALIDDRRYPGVQDEVAPRVLSFWMGFAEYVANDASNLQNERPSWLNAARETMLRVLSCCMNRSVWPSASASTIWDSEDLDSFKAFRMDVIELAQTTYVALGVEVIENIGQRVLELIETRQWSEAESCLWIINALSESSASQDDRTGATLARIFGSELFASNGTSAMQCSSSVVRLRKTSLSTISVFANFFLNRPEYLYPVLGFLFTSLEDPDVEAATAKAICNVCSTCRDLLVPKIDIFLQYCFNSLSSPSTGQQVREDLIFATTVIIQAMRSDEDKLKPLESMLEAISASFTRGIDMVSQDSDLAKGLLLSGLKYLQSMSKSLQQPDDPLTDPGAPHNSSALWTAGRGRHLQEVTLQMIFQASYRLNKDTEIIEACCHIIRTGIKESEPGLFVYQPEMITKYLEATNPDTARLEYVIETTANMLVKQEHHASDNLVNLVIQILNHLRNLISTSKGSSLHDPDLLAAVLEFMSRITPRYVQSLLLLPDDSKDLFQFAIFGINGPEALLKQAAANFWAIFVQRHDLDAAVLSLHNLALETYIPLLIRELVFQIGGRAQRSQLDSLGEPLKKLIFHRAPQAKRWLEASLTDVDFPSRKVDDSQKRLWALKMMSLRGGRQSNAVIKEFWIQCSGSELSYKT